VALFYYIDGPLKGQTIVGDFRYHQHGSAIYTKHTYAMIVSQGNSKMRVYCDIASCSVDLPKELPKEAYCNIVKECVQGESFDVDEFLPQQEIVNEDGVLKEVKHDPSNRY